MGRLSGHLDALESCPDGSGTRGSDVLYLRTLAPGLVTVEPKRKRDFLATRAEAVHLTSLVCPPRAPFRARTSNPAFLRTQPLSTKRHIPSYLTSSETSPVLGLAQGLSFSIPDRMAA